MKISFPKDDSKYHWTNHVKGKMAYYGLTGDRIKRVIRNPKRVENGLAENTIAVMVPGTNRKKPSEIWAMYQRVESRKLKIESGKNRSLGPQSTFNTPRSKLVIISAWRYPGISRVRDKIPIPQDILDELKKEGIVI